MEFDTGLAIQYVFYFFLFTVMVLGLLYGLSKDVEVDVGYMNGILTASSILFGFWAILIKRKPKERTNKWQFEAKKWQYQLVARSFYGSLILLMASVLLIYLSAIDMMSSVLTLIFCTMSLFFNAYLIAITLYYYEFKES